MTHVLISSENGFTEKETEGSSSLVFIRQDKIYKINKRNSVERQMNDLAKLQDVFRNHTEHLPDTEIIECEFKNERYTCLIQPVIQGVELKHLSEDLAHEAIVTNRNFIEKLLEFFFESIAKRERYPDPVGYPQDPRFMNSINLMVEKETGRLILCDVGLSPHEDTLHKHGLDFYNSENVKTYCAKMMEFQTILRHL